MRLRLVYDGRIVCDLMDRDRGADVASMDSCAWEKICRRWASKIIRRKRTLFLNDRLNYVMDVVVDMLVDNSTLVDNRALFRGVLLGEI